MKSEKKDSKITGVSPVKFIASATIILDNSSINPIIEVSLSPDNRISPPARIESRIQSKKVHFILNSFERSESLLKATNDILGAAQLVENVLLSLDNQKYRK
ncbi:MAG: hypothetical protein ACXAEU_03535 [Candidatus Hodarchaeales archaeon]|jgi:hypothetical protein